MLCFQNHSSVCRILIFLSLTLSVSISGAGCGGKVETTGKSGKSTQNGTTTGGTGGTTSNDTTVPDFVSVDPNSGVATRKKCAKNEECAKSGAECISGECYKNDDPCKSVTCGALERCEHGTGKFAKNAFCVPNCNKSEQCGGVCRSSNTAICVDLQWVEPCADSRNHCVTDAGPICCNAGSECLNKQCIPVGDSCDLDQEIYCKTTEYCDMSIKKCIKYAENKGICEVRPDSSKFQPVKKLNWNKAEVFSTPLVIDLDKDGTPEIVFNSMEGYYTGNTVAIRSKPGALPTDVTEVWRSSGGKIYSHSAPAAADLDGDGYPEVIAVNSDGDGLVIFDGRTGNVLHETQGTSMPPKPWAGGVSVGDIDADGVPEIVALGSVWSNQGKELFKLPFNYPKLSSTYGLVNTIPVLANVDNDPNNYLEIIDGLCVFQYVPSGGGGFQMKQVTKNDSTTDVADRPYMTGYSEGVSSTSAIANFLRNASANPQIVAVHNGRVYIADWRGNELSSADAPPLDADAQNNSQMTSRGARGGAPTIADFDGDGEPEIGVAFGHAYTVYDVNVNSSGIPELSISWSTAVQDYSSAITGSSVFDFDGDGKAEVVYNDETTLHVFSGGGTTMFEVGNSTGTAAESAVIADVDNDGHADIVVASNPYGLRSDKGIQVFSDIHNEWVPTRPIWNQHAYSVTNINTDGTVPQVQKKNWTKGWLNNFRQNVQAGNPFLAPDFVVKVDPIYQNGCVKDLPDKLQLRYEVQNLGSSVAKAGTVVVKVYTEQIPDPPKEVATLTKTNVKDLPPNGRETYEGELTIKGTPLETKPFDLKFVVDQGNKYKECFENNNEFLIPNVGGDNADAEVELAVTNGLDCLTTNEVKFSVKVVNNGKAPILANSTEVTLYATVGGTARKKIGTVPITNDVPSEGSIVIPYTWSSFKPEYQFKHIKVEAVIDEGDTIRECDERNNTTLLELYCGNYG